MLLACRDGWVLLFWCSDYGHLYLRVSRDDGCTFGEARNLTGAIDGFRKEWPVTLWAIAPGHGVEMKTALWWCPVAEPGRKRPPAGLLRLPVQHRRR